MPLYLHRCLAFMAFCPVLCLRLFAQQTAGTPELTAAYHALQDKNYDEAIKLFHAGLAAQPGNETAFKDLAYTLLKTGDALEARDAFAAAMRLKPADETASLEFAFLAFETHKGVEARRTFDRLRKHGSNSTRLTAEQAFENIDRPLAAGIARWQEALHGAPNPQDPALYSAHWELAQLAELRDDLPLAAAEYQICRKVKPEKSELLLHLARVWQQLNRVEDAHAALLAASRSSDARTAETALEQTGSRYPYPYEFVNAIDLDPKNIPLRRELAFLYLAIGKQPEAIDQFRKVLGIDANDRLSHEQLDALTGAQKHSATATATITAASPAVDPRAMGLKSFALGYARDAIRYLRQAHEESPEDAEIMLKLGFAYNYAHDDFDALQWFDRVRQGPDSDYAAQAETAYRNLKGDPVAQTTVWSLPMYSSRWHDVFDYGQIKRTLPLPAGLNRYLSLYVSARFSGDVRSSIPQAAKSLYLSDSSVIPAIGVSSKTWHHLTAWGEAGESIQYLPFRHDSGHAVPDYRGGLSIVKGFGALLGGESTGFFFETTGDAEYVSRYGKDWIFTAQNRMGRTFRYGSRHDFQLAWNGNYLHDLKNQYWAETVETGPGLRINLPGTKPNLYLSADFLRGAYTNNMGNPYRPNYTDLRISFWYAVTK